ncbi:MAG: hypothetical protein MUE44_13815 [Oscillatoriaceae cyanobacterium Prado104]|jgi:hypothetical protein|nr:hypothetical protein [Oscillatoriaceae cyanobacterium Prado104]
MKETEGKYAVLSGGKTDGDSDIWNEEELAKILNFDGISFKQDLDPGLEYGSADRSFNPSESQPPSEGSGEREGEKLGVISGVPLPDQTAPRAYSMGDMFEDPIAAATKPTLAKNPFAKVSVVGAILGLAFLVAALFLSGIMGERKPHTAKVQPSPSPEPKTQTQTGTPPDVGDYKTQAAVGSQQQKLSDLESQRNSRAPKTSNLAAPKNSRSDLKSPNPEKTPAPAAIEPNIPPAPPPAASNEPVRSAPAAVPDSLPSRSYFPPPPVRVREVVRPAPIQPPSIRSPQSIPGARERPPEMPSQRPTPASPSPPPDPHRQWAALAALGSFGRGSVAETDRPGARSPSTSEALNPETVGVVEAPGRSNPTESVLSPGAVRNGAFEVAGRSNSPESVLNPGGAREQPVVRNPVANFRSAVSVVAVASSPDDLGTAAMEPQFAPETVAPADAPSAVVFAGQSLSGTLSVPAVAFSSNRAAPDGVVGERFAVSLTMPLMASDGTVVLPETALIVFQVDRVLANGYVEAHAVAAVDGLAEYRLPRNAVSVRGRGGEPLMAQRRTTGGSELLRMDLTAFVLGAAGRVGERLNQPTSESSTQTAFGSSSSVTRGSPNILGAVMEGGTTPVLQQILQRNQQAAAEIQSRPPLWYVPAKTEVLVFVNSSFSLGM